ncbi:AAA family ATPase, partial [uncultured Lamprocystis sp.]
MHGQTGGDRPSVATHAVRAFFIISLATFLVMKRSLTGLYLENFRSIKGPASIALSPITLFYGPNSAGKTAIREALRIAGDLCTGNASWPDLIKSMHHHDYSKKMVIGVSFREGYFQGFLDESTVGITRYSYEEILPDLFKYMEGDEICGATFDIKFEITFGWYKSSNHDTPLLTSHISHESITANGLPLITNDSHNDTIVINLELPLAKSIDWHIRGTGESISTLAEAVFIGNVVNALHPLLFLHLRNDFCDRRFCYDDNDESVFNDGMQESIKRRMLQAIIGSIYFVPLKIAGRLLTDLCHIGPLRHIPTESQLTFLLKRTFTDDYSVYASLEPASWLWADGSAAWKSLAENKCVHQHYAKNRLETLNLLEAVNEWLTSKQRLGMMHTIIVKYGSVQFLSDSKSQPSFDSNESRANSRMLPDLVAGIQLKDLNLPVEVRDVGAGVPQLVPIIVAGFINGDIVSTKVSCFQLSHEPHHRGDQGILRRFVGPPAINTKTLPAEVLCEPTPQVGEGIFGALRGRIAARRRVLQMRAIDPSDGGRRHAEIQMIGHGIGVA